MENTLNLLSRRAGFNAALRHFKSVNAFAADVADGFNLADSVNDAIEDGSIDRYQVRSILNAILVDKLDYVCVPHNLERTIEDVDDLIDATSKWGKVHIVLCYYHPQAGLYAINPANEAHWDDSLPLVHDEYCLILVGPAVERLDRDVLESAASDFVKLLYGRKVKSDTAYRAPRKVYESAPPPPPPSYDAPRKPAAAAPTASGVTATAAPSAGGRRAITPKYSVVVTNELFHNGNVEAWKKVIASYRNKYAGLDVLIWYENERINDINSLFKWGKVKHGTPIMFSVAGENIADVRKLQRYLYEGASPRFEAFLKGGIDRVLDLF